MVGIELDFIKTQDVMENPNESTWEFVWKEADFLHLPTIFRDFLRAMVARARLSSSS
jgi:hypothetical protein